MNQSNISEIVSYTHTHISLYGDHLLKHTHAHNRGAIRKMRREGVGMKESVRERTITCVCMSKIDN